MEELSDLFPAPSFPTPYSLLFYHPISRIRSKIIPL